MAKLSICYYYYDDDDDDDDGKIHLIYIIWYWHENMKILLKFCAQYLESIAIAECC